jgi:hypothetical protein
LYPRGIDHTKPGSYGHGGLGVGATVMWQGSRIPSVFRSLWDPSEFSASCPNKISSFSFLQIKLVYLFKSTEAPSVSLSTGEML